MNENENTTYQNLQNASEAILRGKLIALNTYIRKKDLESMTSVLTLLETEKEMRTSLVVQWLRVCLPMQGTRFKPWSGKIPHAAEQLKPCATTTEPVLYSL